IGAARDGGDAANLDIGEKAVGGEVPLGPEPDRREVQLGPVEGGCVMVEDGDRAVQQVPGTAYGARAGDERATVRLTSGAYGRLASATPYMRIVRVQVLPKGILYMGERRETLDPAHVIEGDDKVTARHADALARGAIVDGQK